MRNWIKTIFYLLLFYFTKISFFACKQKQSATVLMYHSFDDTHWKYGVKPKELNKQILYLIKHKTIVPLKNVVKFSGGESNIEKDAVAITVDDGYEDTYFTLFPLAKKYNFPFTIFLTSDLNKHKKLGNLPRPSWDKLKEMHKSGLVSIEVHGRTHVNWVDIEKNENELAKEVLDCRNDIEKKIGTRPYFAAYPAGRRSVILETYLKTNNFKGAVAITEGAVYEGDNVFALRRVQVDKTMNMFLFKARLNGPVFKIMKYFRKTK